MHECGRLKVMMMRPQCEPTVMRARWQESRERAIGSAEGMADAEKEDHVEVIANGYRLAWDTEALIRSFSPDWVEPVGQRVSLAFKCESPQAVDALYTQLVAAGYTGRKAPWDAFWGQRYATILDPDRNAVDLFAPL